MTGYVTREEYDALVRRLEALEAGANVIVSSSETGKDINRLIKDGLANFAVEFRRGQWPAATRYQVAIG